MSYAQAESHVSSKRSRNLTEKARLHSLDTCQRRRNLLDSKLRTQLLLMEVLIEDNKQAELQEGTILLERLFSEYMECHSKCQMLIIPSYDELDNYSTESIDRKVSKIKRKVMEVCEDSPSRNEREDPNDRANRSVKSKSSAGRTRKSSKSGRSSNSVESQMVRERARLAELQVEAKFLQEQQRMEQESKAFKLNFEMAKSRAKIEAYREVENEEEQDQKLDQYCGDVDKEEFVTSYVMSHQIQSQANLTVNDPEHPKWKQNIPGSNKDLKETQSSEIKEKIVNVPNGLDQLSDIIKQIQAPTVELDVFSGNCIDYPYFMATFSEVVEAKITDPRGRLTRLIKYLQDEAKELVQPCVYLPPADGFIRAKKLLEKQYGDRYKILAQYRKELKSWPKLKSHDSKGFRQFYSFLLKYKATMETLKTGSAYDSPELLQRLQLILPTFLQERWNRRNYQCRKRKDVEAGIDEFIAFVEEESTIINDPNYSRWALQEFRDEDTSFKSKKTLKSMLTGSSNKSCPVCDEGHDLDKCGKYLQLQVEERRKLLYDKKLCFGCYGPSSETHRARSCHLKRQCDTCGGTHPTGLHGYQRRRTKPPDNYRRSPSTYQQQGNPIQPENTAPIGVGFSKLDLEVTSLNVVAVQLTHPSSSTIIHTKALLDTGSQGTFVHENILDQLKIRGAATKISIKTMSGSTTEESRCVNNLVVSAPQNSEIKICLPKTYSRSFIPVDKDEIPTPSKVKRWKYLDVIHPFLQQEDDNMEVGILIGGNCPRALEPLKVIPCQGDGPYAFKSALGWCVTGPIRKGSATAHSSRCNFVALSNDKKPVRFIFEDQIKENGLKDAIIQMLNQDFSEKSSNNNVERMSINDHRFLKIMEEGIKFNHGHYELPLPLKDPDKWIPNNRIQAIKRAQSLKRKLQKDQKMHEDYCTFMNKLLDKAYAKKVSQSNDGKTWYLPHHGVYHPKKPEKIRVVFDCSAVYKGVSLNSMLLQGPDLTNQIVGVLTRFREERIALVADIESMFYQVRVPVEQHDMLRFVWWPEGNLDEEPEDYVMCVHLFGGTHSPSTCNYALRRTATDNENQFGAEAATTLSRNFYVDDMLKGAADVESTLKLKQNVQGMCAAGGFNLTQFMSNSRDVLNNIPEEERAKGIKNVNLSTQLLPIERALGVSWCIETDSFCFRIVLKDTPLTRRGILASISSVYDPLGFGSPFVLPAKQLLQQLCSEHKDWDDDISPQQRKTWEKWRESLHLLEDVNIQRCIVPKDFGDVSEVSFHHFSDASTSGYGQVSYTRIVNDKGRIHCSFMIGKARVTPLKPITVPRLELTAATTSAKVAKQLKTELSMKPDSETFWTDSKVVLGYISNLDKKFHMFVTNRIQAIHDLSQVEQWRYVPTDENPSDDGSRGLTVEEFVRNRRWINGPSFLWEPLAEEEIKDETYQVDKDDPEVKKEKSIKVNAVNIKKDAFEELFERVSSWYRLKRIFATMLSWRYKKKVDVDLLIKAELAIVRQAQKNAQQPDRKHQGKVPLNGVDSFIDEDGVLRVGGRISKSSSLSWKLKHPIIMPKKHRVSIMIIQHFHKKTQHGGRDATLNEIRQNGFTIISANSRVRNEIFKCVHCRRFRGKLGEQKMADLPSERCSESAPFTYSGVDMFGPFIIKEGRKEMKRYVALFTCFASRAVHLESTNSLNTDSFIMALRRFINRRGEVRQIRSDNGSNFVGANAEFKKAILEMDQGKINDFLLRHQVDWLGWKFNPPTASHMGGVWERQIRSCRSILTSLLRNHSQSLNDESFRTVLTEVEAIVNSRPLTVEVLSDSNSLAPLTPNHLLTSKSKIVMAPPGNFTNADMYSRRRWRRVQHLVNEFWSRWRSEYLQTLQSRKKWNRPRRNFTIGDVILLKDDGLNRNDWRLGRIIEVKRGDDQLVRSVVVQTSTNAYERPVAKIVLLVEAEGERIPDEEP